MGVHAAVGSACSRWECMQQMGVHAADGGACSRWGCMQQIGEHAAIRSACSSRECMQQMRVHAADGSACSRWECMQQMGVHAADGSACSRWECMQQMQCLLCVQPPHAVALACLRCTQVSAVALACLHCTLAYAVALALPWPSYASAPAQQRPSCPKPNFVPKPTHAWRSLHQTKLGSAGHGLLSSTALTALNKAGIGGTWPPKQHSAHRIKRS